jgi:hypothetical protein
MAEKRQKSASILLEIQGKAKAKIEFFPAEQWPDKVADSGGLYRVRIDGRWIMPHTERFGFFTPAGLGHLLAEFLDPDPGQSSPPELPRGTSVSVPSGAVLGGQPLLNKTRTTTEPIRAFNGRWYVGVLKMNTTGPVMVPVDIVKWQRREKAAEYFARMRAEQAGEGLYVD